MAAEHESSEAEAPEEPAETPPGAPLPPKSLGVFGVAVAREPKPLDLGPTGRPLNSVGAIFEAAFRQFGRRFLFYLGCALLALLPAIVAWNINRGVGFSDYEGFPLLGGAYAFGALMLVGRMTTLVAGDWPARRLSIALSALVGGVISAPASLFPPIAIIIFPPLALATAAVAAGDGSVGGGLRIALTETRRRIGRVYLLLVGLLVWFGGCFAGFALAFSDISDSVRNPLAVVAASLLAWPQTALVIRSFYGDLTGRLVIRPAEGEELRQRQLADRRASKERHAAAKAERKKRSKRSKP